MCVTFFSIFFIMARRTARRSLKGGKRRKHKMTHKKRRKSRKSHKKRSKTRRRRRR